MKSPINAFRFTLWGLSLIFMASMNAQAQRTTQVESPFKLSTTELKQNAAAIDQIIIQALTANSTKPNPRAADDFFLRRAYLDITGAIPTYDQAVDFSKTRALIKRQQLIDELLLSPGYVSHNFNFLADLLRITSRLTNNVRGDHYIQWVKQAVADNMPYDQFAYQLLASNGKIKDNGAVGYYLRDSGMPLDNTSNTLRIFLGTSIGCAQCHDHPFDKWSQIEFYEMAAHTFGTTTRAPDRQKYSQMMAITREREVDPQLRNVMRRLAYDYNSHVDFADRAVRLPDDYKYGDAKPGDAVEAFTMFGNEANPAGDQTIRQAYAQWVTSPENPRFAKVIANRLWKRAFGVGVVEPVDELTDSTVPYIPALMEHLGDLMVKLNFDTREFQRVVFNTAAYQRAVTKKQRNLEDPYLFQGPILRRMTAEQVWDSFVTLAYPKPNKPRPVQTIDLPDIDNMSIDEIRAYASTIVSSKDQMNMMYADNRASRKMDTRAADLPSPAAPGHFLWRFGQSDRELIQNANLEPSGTQVLTLMNGVIDQILLADESVLSHNVRKTNGNAEKLTVVWLSIFARRPTSLERSYANSEIKAHKEYAFDNLVWALLNTREFMFIQ